MVLIEDGETLKKPAKDSVPEEERKRKLFNLRDCDLDERIKWRRTYELVTLDYINQGPEGIAPEGTGAGRRVADDRETLAIIRARFSEVFEQDEKELEKHDLQGDRLRAVSRV
jgi:hypothetical protein